MYLFKIDITYTPSNTLEREVLEYVKGIDRATVDDMKKALTYLEGVQDMIRQLNEINTRCKKEVKLTTREPAPTETWQDIRFYVYGVMSGGFYCSFDEKTGGGS